MAVKPFPELADITCWQCSEPGKLAHGPRFCTHNPRLCMMRKEVLVAFFKQREPLFPLKHPKRCFAIPWTRTWRQLYAGGGGRLVLLIPLNPCEGRGIIPEEDARLGKRQDKLPDMPTTKEIKMNPPAFPPKAAPASPTMGLHLDY